MTTLSSAQLQNGCGWKCPPTGFLKLNVDEALFFDNKKANMGLILRDELGK